jgi:putative transcriptional regulator
MSELFEKIVKGLDEAIQYEKGNYKLARTRRLKIKPLPDYSAEDVKIIRNDLNMSQFVFANVLGVSKKTIEAWESGINKPSGCAKRMLQIISKDKNVVDNIVQMDLK